MTTEINKASCYNCYNTFKCEIYLKGTLETNDLHVFVEFIRIAFALCIFLPKTPGESKHSSDKRKKSTLITTDSLQTSSHRDADGQTKTDIQANTHTGTHTHTRMHADAQTHTAWPPRMSDGNFNCVYNLTLDYRVD